jgi:tetratricopeptide (TPR) repeat protein
VLQWLAAIKELWLLILDNCDDGQIDFAKYIPPRGGSVIITARLEECRTHGTWADVDDLGPEVAVQLLFKASGIEADNQEALVPAAETVVSVLGQHALALVHAGAYIREGYCTLGEYNQFFRHEQNRLMVFSPKQQASQYGNVYTTFEVSAKALASSDRHDSHLALKLLNILAFLDREAVEEDLFIRAFDECYKAESKCQFLWEEDEVQWSTPCEVTRTGDDLLAKQNSGSERHDNPGSITDVSCSWRGRYKSTAGSDDRENGPNETQSAVQSMSQSRETYHKSTDSFSEQTTLPNSVQDIEDGEIYHLCIWHCKKVRSSGLVEQQQGTRLRAACIRLANLSLIKYGNQSVSMHPLVHEWAYARLGEVVRQDAWEQVLSVLALSITHKINWHTLAPKLLPHLDICTRSRSLENRLSQLSLDVIRALYSLAWFYMQNTNFEASLATFETLSSSYQFQPHTWTSKSQVLLREKARCLARLGRVEEMQSCVNQVVDSTTHWFELDSWEASEAQALLAEFYLTAGDSQDAIDLYESIYDRNSRTSILNDGALINVLRGLIRAYESLGHNEQVAILLVEELEVSRRVYPRHHTYLLFNLARLAESYITLDVAEQAVTLLEEVVGLDTEPFPRDHMWFRIVSTLMKAYETLDKYDLAVTVLEEMHTYGPTLYLPNDPQYTATIIRLAHAYSRIGKTSLTIPLLEKVLSIEVSDLPLDDPRRLTSMERLTWAHLELKRSGQATPLIKQVEEGIPDATADKVPNKAVY